MAICLAGATGCVNSPTPSPTADHSGLTLKLIPSITTLRLGQETSVRLAIYGPGIDHIVAGTEGVPDMYSIPPDAQGFVHAFTFEPKREGDFTLGPYTITFNGQKLTSNVIHLQVLPDWDGKFGPVYHVDKTKIALGEEFQLVLETWLKPTAPPQKNFSLRRDAGFTIPMNGGGGGSFRINSTYHYDRQVWTIIPDQAGVFKITGDIFQNFPAGEVPPDLSVEVTPAAPSR